LTFSKTYKYLVNFCHFGLSHQEKTGNPGAKVNAGLPDFSWFSTPKWVKMYQNGGKYTKWP
jgi:hypothetical protein